MNKETLFDLIDSYKEKMQEVLDYLEDHAACGYEEWEATEYLEKAYEELGYTLTRAGDIPGFYTDIDTGRPGPKVLIFSELDGLPISDHPHANPKTGAAHACGHHAQCAALYGVAAALRVPEVLEGLSGSIRLCAVPAEESPGYERIKQLRAEGVVRFLGGKAEFCRRGYFDGCDLAFMIHTGGGVHNFNIKTGCNGGVRKIAHFEGKEFHAAAPGLGINALQAANLALSSINVLRDTFDNYHFVRVNSILRDAGVVVNAVPGRTTLDTQIRANNVNTLKAISRKINRAVAASAASIGAKVHLEDYTGYLPGAYDKNLTDVMLEGMAAVVGAENAKYLTFPWDSGCTDMGDVSLLMPAVHAFGSGGAGGAHSPGFHIADFDSACMDSAKAQVMIVRLLLDNDAEKAKYIVENAKPYFKSKEEYVACVESLFLEKDAVVYEEDGKVTLDI